MLTNLGFLLCVFTLLTCVQISAAEKPAPTLDSQPAIVEYEMRLLNSLVRQGPQTSDAPSLLCTLRRTGDRWERVWGVARSLGNPGLFHGWVRSATIAANRMDFSLEFEAIADPGLVGYVAAYQVTVESRNGAWAGSYSGIVNTVPVSGSVALVLPPPFPPTGRTAAALSEHPRVLFRTADLPALRAKAKTPFGKAALERFEGPLGAAMKYQLLEDPAQAQTARALTEAAMAVSTSGDKMHRGRPWGWRLEQVGLAYDLCYHAWDEPFKAKIRQWIARSCQRVLLDWGSFHQEIAWSLSDGTQHPPVMYAGAGLALLATLGDAGSEQIRPLPALAGASLPGIVGWTPADGTPVLPFTSGRPPADWLCVGGLKLDDGPDPLDAIGGIAARPGPGTAITSSGATHTFSLLSSRPKGFTASGGLDITNAFKRVFESRSYFFTVIRNDASRWVRISSRPDAGCSLTMALSGRPIGEGDCLRLEPGLHTLLIAADIGTASDWGVIGCTPTLTELSDDEAKSSSAWLARSSAIRQALFAQGQASARAIAPTASSELVRLHEIAAFFLRQFSRESIGSGGYGGISNLAMEGPGKYFSSYRQMFGRTLSPWPDASHYLQRRMFAHRFGIDGKDLVQGFSGDPGFVCSSYGEGPRDATIDVGMMLLPLVPVEQQPAVVWLLQRAAKATPDNLAALLNAPAKPYSPVQGWFNSIPVYTFLNYPLDMPAQSPEKCMPLHWSASDAGWHGIRSGWQGADEFIVQVHARSGAQPAHNAGGFRVLGLGREWINGLGGRWSEPVVQMHEDTLAQDARCTVTSVETRPGILSVTMDLTAAYAEANTYERYGAILRSRTPSGITGTRAIAVDLSGVSGAPCLIVIVDRVKGGGPKTWSLPFLDGTFKVPCPKIISDEHFGVNGPKSPLSYKALLKKHSAAASQAIAAFKATSKDWIPFQNASDAIAAGMTITSNGFQIQHPQGTLRATVLQPSTPVIKTGASDQMHLGPKATFSLQSICGIQVTGGDDYFIVMTIQPGEAPKVMSVGSTLSDTVVTVGKRSIRYVNDRLVLSEL